MTAYGNWHKDAACRHAGPDLFFPVGTGLRPFDAGLPFGPRRLPRQANPDARRGRKHCDAGAAGRRFRRAASDPPGPGASQRASRRAAAGSSAIAWQSSATPGVYTRDSAEASSILAVGFISILGGHRAPSLLP
jgi:hypothetical protein